jgi:hypothetical protein
LTCIETRSSTKALDRETGELRRGRIAAATVANARLPLLSMDWLGASSAFFAAGVAATALVAALALSAERVSAPETG